MFSVLKKNWFFVLIFVSANFVFYSFFSFMAEPVAIEDLFSPVLFLFQIIAITSPFLVSIAMVLIFRKNVKGFLDKAFLVFFSTLVFSLIFLSLASYFFLTLSEQDIEDAYIQDILSSPYELTIDEFKVLNSFQSFLSGVTFLFINLGSAFFGLFLGELFVFLFEKRLKVSKHA